MSVYSKLILSVLFLISILGCVSDRPAFRTHSIAYAKTKELNIGVAAENIERILGEPDLIEPEINVPGSDRWVYYLPQHKLIEVVFLVNRANKLIDGKIFNFMSDDKISVDEFKATMPNVKFENSRRKQTSDQIPDEVYHRNDSVGIYFTSSATSKELSKIMWINTKNATLTAAMNR